MYVGGWAESRARGQGRRRRRTRRAEMTRSKMDVEVEEEAKIRICWGSGPDWEGRLRLSSGTRHYHQHQQHHQYQYGTYLPILDDASPSPPLPDLWIRVRKLARPDLNVCKLTFEESRWQAHFPRPLGPSSPGAGAPDGCSLALSHACSAEKMQVMLPEIPSHAIPCYAMHACIGDCGPSGSARITTGDRRMDFGAGVDW